MVKIGLLSDTHSNLDPKIFEYFQEVDEIWHAGDIGSIEVTDQLKKFKPLRAVFGNIDDHILRREFPEFNRFTIENVEVLMTHIGGKPGKYAKPALDAIQEKVPKLFICGHSHILLVKMDPKFNMLCMNPGACGIKGFHQVKTLLRFQIEGDKIQNLEAIEIGKRV
jgi:putative phosphoesterase